MGELFHVSSNPHIRASHTTGRIMMTVLIALMPAAVFGIFNFGMDAGHDFAFHGIMCGDRIYL